MLGKWVRSINGVTMVVISVILFLFMTTLTTYVATSSYNSTFNMAKESMLQLNKNVVTSVEDLIDSHLSLIKVLSLQSNVKQFLKGEGGPILDYVKNQFAVYKGINSLMVFNTKGIVTAGYNASGGDISGLNIADRKYTIEALAGRECINPDIIVSKTTGEAIFVISVPVLDESGKVLGGAAVTVNWGTYLAKHVLPVKFGENGRVAMVDAKGLIIAHANKELMFQDFSSKPFIQEAMRQKSGFMQYALNGQEKVQAFEAVGRTGWVVSVTAPLADMTLAAEAQRNTLIVAGLIGYAVMLFAIATLLRTQVVRPLRSLMAFSAEIARGNFKASLEGRFRFELKELADNILNMTKELKNKLGFAQGVLAGLTTPVVICGTDDTVRYTNPAMLALLGQPGAPKDHEGEHVSRFFYGDSNKETFTQKCLKENKSFENVELQATFHGGNTLFLRVDASPIQDLDGQLIGAITTLTDLTAIREQQRRMQSQQEAMIQAAQVADGVANRLSTATEQISAQIEESSRGAQTQSQRVGETATAMDQMNTTVMEVAKNASNAANTADKAKLKAQQGSDIVRQVVGGIAGVQKQALDLKADMTTLGGQAQGIGQIMNVISDIADQTNLLALNAAIEAARAGEAGRGFAVVADEVRKLAEKTMTATKEVGDSIQGIQGGTSKNIGNVDNAVRMIDEATSLADKSGQALVEIVSLVELTTDQVRSIAAASEEQSAASEQIGRSIEEVDRISSETADAMGQSSKAVTELAELALVLKNLIVEMQAGEGDRSPSASPALPEGRPRLSA